MSDGQTETRSDGNEKKFVLPLAAAADDGLLLIPYGQSKVVQIKITAIILYQLTTRIIPDTVLTVKLIILIKNVSLILRWTNVLFRFF